MGAGYEPKEILRYLAGRGYASPYEGSDEDIIRQHMTAVNKPFLDYEYADPAQDPRVSSQPALASAQLDLPALPPPALPASLQREGLSGPPADVPPALAPASSPEPPAAPRRDSSSFPEELPVDPYAWLPESWQAPARSFGESLSSLSRRANPGGDANEPVSGGTGITLADMIPQSKTDAGLALASMLPVGKGLKAVRRKIVGEGALTGENVLKAAERLNAGEGISYGKWLKENPEAGATLFDLATAKPAGVFPPGSLPRTPVGRADIDRTVAAFRKPKVIAQLQEWINAGMQKMPDS